MVRVMIPATTANMGPGFDTLGMALELYNIVEMEEIDTGLEIVCTGLGDEIIPRDESNTVYQAATKVFSKIKAKPMGLKITLENQIPLSSGLGSSAAAIVGGLVGANNLMGNKLTEQELMNLASEIEGHPDNIAPALLGGIVISAIVEKQVIYSTIAPPKNLKCVIAIPRFPLATKVSREVLPNEVSFSDAVFNISRTALLVSALHQGTLDLLSFAMEDKIHQPYRSRLIPGMDRVFELAKKAGAKSISLSGAGPTIIAYTSGNEELVLEAIREGFNEAVIDVDLRIVKPSLLGAKIV